MNPSPLEQNYNIQEIIHDFQIKSITALPTIQSILYELEYLKNGARMIHIANDMSNNCFGIGFRTTPKDNTGIAHILEHFVMLCGSKNYPLRNVLFSMLKRSLITLMNASTDNDFTIYRFATQNKTDYFNFMSAYLDAVLFPLLTEQSFMQEGCRIELQDNNDIQSDIMFKGVVFNEMKAGMSMQYYIMKIGIMRGLFPTSTYGYNHGGDPIDIPNLTLEKVKEFHQNYYHPSNSWIYTYGNIPLEENLACIGEQLKKFPTKNTTNTEVAVETRSKEPYLYTLSYPIQENELNGKNHQIALGWILCNIQETDLVFSLEVLEDILLGNSASPLKKKLLESNLGEQLSDTTGFESKTKDTFFLVGLKGVKEADIDKVENLILETLKEIVENGIEQQLIETSLHQFEISLRGEIHKGRYPTGFNLLHRFFGLWMHGGDYKICLDLDQLLSILSKKLKKENYFESLIQEYLIDNNHRVKMILSPDVEHNKKQEDHLDKMLAAIQEKLTIESRKTLQMQTNAFNEDQNKKEDHSLLPTVEIEDIIIDDKTLLHQKSKIDQTQVYSFSVPTNGLTYLSLDFNVTEILKPEEYPLLHLLSIFMTSAGNKLMNYDEFALKMSNKTGGINVNHGLLHSVQKNQFLSKINITGYAINRNFESLTELLSTILFEISFHDFDRAKNLLKQVKNSFSNSIIEKGHLFALNYALKNFNHFFQLKEITSGISYIQYINILNEKNDQELKELFVNMENLAKKIFSHKPTALVAISDDDKILNNNTQFQSLLSPFTQKNSDSFIPIQTIDGKEKYLNDLLITSSAIAYNASVFQTATYGDADCAPLEVLANLLQSEFLHKEIRDKGGAYFAGSIFNNIDGSFAMFSYADPNIERTFAVYHQAIEWVLAGQFDEQNIKEAILQVFSKQLFSSVSFPLSPSAEAFQEYEFQKIGKTLEMRKNYKQQLLQVNKEQIISVAKKWLTQKSSKAVITGNEKANENAQFLKQNKFNRIQI